jgi:hypothetical protein
MVHGGMRSFWLMASLVVWLPAQDEGLRAGETAFDTPLEFPGAERLDADGQERTWVVRIFDAVDRRPIAGALVQSPWHPDGGVVDAELHHQAVAITDEYGFARMPWATARIYRDYTFADAPGYCADEKCLPGEADYELLRGVDVPIEVIDWMGNPVPGGRVELVLGCGHVPPQRSVVTDASGRAVLPNIDPQRLDDFYVWSPGCQHYKYELYRKWLPGDAPVPIYVKPGGTVEGRVVDAAGAPVVAARVGAMWAAQGESGRPWTRTDRDGRFQLVGLERWRLLAVQPPPQFGLPHQLFMAPPTGVFRTLVLGSEPATQKVAVQVRAGEEIVDDVTVAAVRIDDGFTEMARTDEAGLAELLLPEGRFRALVDGGLGPFGDSETAFEVGQAPRAPLTLNVPKNPTVRVDVSKVAGMGIAIATATRSRWLELPDEGTCEVPVPRGEPARFRITTDESGVPARFMDVPPPGSSLVLEPLPSTTVWARFVGPDGKPVAASLSVFRPTWDAELGAGGGSEDAEASAAVITRHTGSLTWLAEPRDSSLMAQQGTLQARPGGAIDLGEIRFAAAPPPESQVPELTVTLPEGLLGDGQVRWCHDGSSKWGNLDEGILQDPGLWHLTVGEILNIDVYGAMAFRFVVPGPPPWVAPYPKGVLTLRVQSAAGRALSDVRVFVDGTARGHDFTREPTFALRGVTAGPQIVIVAERGHQARVHRLLFTEGEQRTLLVELQDLPAPR